MGKALSTHKIALLLVNFVLTALLLQPSTTFAQQGPASLNISGGLFNSSGTPITNSNVNFKIEVYDKSATCLMYSEQHLGVDLSTTKGAFSLIIGSGTSMTNVLEGTTAFDSKLFENPGAVAAFTGCPSGLTLNAGDTRLIRVSYNLGSGYIAMTPDIPLTSSAYAMVAETLGGHSASEFILSNVNSSLSQANVEYAFSNTNWPTLKSLIDGTSGEYIPSTPTSAVGFNSQRLINVGTPTGNSDAATKGYADGNLGGEPVDMTGVAPGMGGGKILTWDQTLGKWVAGSTGAVGLVASGTGLTGGPITTSGTLSVDVGVTANKILQLDPSARIPAVNGSLLTNINAVQLQGRDISAVAPGSGNLLAWNATTNMWEATPNPGGTVTGLSGDVSGSGSGVISTTINNNAVTAAKINNTGIAVNRLLITDGATGATVGYSTCSLGEVLQWSATGWKCESVSLMLGNVGTAGTFGNSTQVAQVTVDATGRVTNLTNVNINFPVTSVNGHTGVVSLIPSDIAGLGTAATRDVGLNAGNVLQLLTNNALPALDGSALTNLPVASSQWNTSGQNIFYNLGNVGIGTSSPAAQLDVQKSATGTSGAVLGSSQFTTNYQPASAPAGGTQVNNVFTWLNTLSTADLTNVTALGGNYTVQHLGGSNINTAIGLQSASIHAGTGTMTQSVGGQYIVSNTSTGTITNAIGVNVSGANSGGGTITNSYGLQLGAIPATNRWGVYQSDSTAKNYFAGNVGIGTTTPGVKLDVAGTINASAITINGVSVGTSSSPWLLNGSSAYYNLGNVGIGTSTPQFPLDIVGDANVSGISYASEFRGSMLRTPSTQEAVAISAGVVRLYTAGAERARIDNSGNFGIGTLTPGAALDVQSSTSASSGIAYGMKIGQAVNQTGTAGFSTLVVEADVTQTASAPNDIAEFKSGNNVKANIDQNGGFTFGGFGSIYGGVQIAQGSSIGYSIGSTTPPTNGLLVNGNVGIGTATPNYKLDVAGTVNATALTINGVAVGTSSSPWLLNGSNAYYNGGNVGIGTSTPNGTFDVRGGTAAAGNGSNINIFAQNGFTSGATDGGNIILMPGAGHGAGSSGALTIGTTDASQAYVTVEAGSWQTPLDIDYNAPNTSYDDGIFLNNAANSADGAALILSHSKGGVNAANDELGKIEFGGSDSSGQLWMSEIRSNITNTTHATATSTLSFATTNSGTMANRMIILGNGNVGIGTVTPNYKLDVNGTVNASALMVNGVAVGTSSSPWQMSGTTTYYNGGNVGIGTTSPTVINGIDYAANTVAQQIYSSTLASSFVLNGVGGGSYVILDSTAPANQKMFGFTGSGGKFTLSSVADNGTPTPALSLWASSSNIGLGIGAMASVTTGNYNVAMGSQNLLPCTDCNYNTAVGDMSLFSNAHSWDNTGLGARTLYNTSGGGNTAVGSAAGQTIVAGNNNTVLGMNVASTTLASGSNNILIGTTSAVDTPAAGTNNFLNVGNLLFATGMNGTLAAPAGNVGIGTASPNAKLDVNGTVNASGFTVNGVAIGTSSSPWLLNGTNAYYNSGNVGIGTTTPGNLLTIGASGWNSSPRQAIQIQEQGYAEPSADGTNSNGDKLVLWNLTGTGQGGTKHAMGVGPYELWFQASGNSSDHISFFTGPTMGATPLERLRIDSGGNVGIGTSSPGSALDVVGSAVVDATGTNNGGISAGLKLGGDLSGEGISSKRTAGGNQFGLDFYTQNAARLSVDHNGAVGINNTNPTNMSSSNLLDVYASDASKQIMVENANSTTSDRYPGITVFNAMGTSTFGGYPYLLLQNSRGSEASQVALAAGDRMGLVSFGGYDGASNSSNNGPYIGGVTTQTWSSGAHGSALTFAVTPNGGSGHSVAMTLDQNGRLGVGTSTPQSGLEVAATGASSALIVPRDSTTNRPTGVNGMIRYNTDTSSFEGYSNGAWNALGAGVAGQWNTSGSDIYYNIGNVGIGTNAPGLAYDFRGGGTGLSADLLWGRMGGNDKQRMIEFGQQNDTGGDSHSYIQSTKGNANAETGHANYDLLINPYGGQVSIGTKINNFRPFAPVEIWGPSVAQDSWGTLDIVSSSAMAKDAGPQIDFAAMASGTTNIGSYAAISGRKENATSMDPRGYLVLSTSHSDGTVAEGLRVDSNGNVGIGTTSPGAVLEVGGGGPAPGETPELTVAVDGSHAGVRVVQDSTGIEAEFDPWQGTFWMGTESNHPLLLVTNDQPRVTIDETGRVGVGTLSPVESLEIPGAIKIGNSSNGSPAAGTIKWTGTTFQAYTGSAWFNIIPNPPAASACDQTITFNSAGGGIYTVPNSYATITVKVWGAGGSGGGIWGSASGNGGASSVASLGLSASGGGAGSGAGMSDGVGGVGGIGAGGDSNFNGNSGATGTDSQSGSGGNAPAGGGAGAPGTSFWAVGGVGATPGGGGSGAYGGSANSGAGGGGSGGYTQKTFTPATLPPNTSITDIIVGAGGVGGGDQLGGNGGTGQVSITCSTTGLPAASNNGIVYLNSGGAYTTASTFVYNSGNVGIATASPQAALDVQGQIRSKSSSTTGSTIDFANGNAVTTSYNCAGNISFVNLLDGGSYTLAVTDAGTTTCGFNTTTTGNEAATVTYKFSPANGPRTISSHTIYSIQRIGTTVYISWVTGFQ